MSAFPKCECDKCRTAELEAEIKRLQGKLSHALAYVDGNDKDQEIEDKQVEIERLQAIANDCLSRLQEVEEVGQRDDGTWYWCASGDPIGEAAEATKQTDTPHDADVTEPAEPA